MISFDSSNVNVNKKKTNLFYLTTTDNQIKFNIKNDYSFDDLYIIDFSANTTLKFSDFNFITLYKNKYSKEDIKQQKLIVFADLQKIINQVRQVLSILTDGKLSTSIVETDVDFFLNSTIIQNAELDVDLFFGNIGHKLTDLYRSDTFIKDSASFESIEQQALVRLYWYFIEVESLLDNVEVSLGFVHIYDAFCYYWNVFNFLLEIKKKFSFFFISLLSAESIYDKDINLFFLQFEFFVLIDIFHHNSYSHLNKYKINFGLENYKQNYVTYCKEVSYRLFLHYCGKTRLLDSKSVSYYDVAILTALENYFRTKRDVSGSYSFSDSFYKECKDFISVLEIVDVDNKFGVLYNDCILDLSYILSMVEALNYSLMVSPFFLNRFISK